MISDLTCIAEGCGKQLRYDNKSGRCKEHFQTPEYTRAYRLKNPNKKREESWSAQGVDPSFTYETYLEMIRAQGGKCALCGSDDPGPTRSGTRVWHVDHDHSTGRVRSLLCMRCNRALGLFGDDSAVLRRAVAYLESFVVSRDAA